MEFIVFGFIIILLGGILLTPILLTQKKKENKTDKPADLEAFKLLQGMMGSKNIKVKGDILEYSIVGEASYKKELSEIVGECPDHGIVKKTEVLMESEPNNPYDKNAIVVKIKNRTIGYIAKTDVWWFKKFLDKSSDGKVTRIAEIRGGGIKKTGEKLAYGVFLQVPLK